MTGTIFAVAIVFVILFVTMQSIGYYRSRFSVADAERSEGDGVGQSAAIGAGAGLIVLLLMALLYVGVAQWDWFGRPAPKAPVVAAPAKESPPPVLGGVGATPSAAPAGASPSASPSP